MGEPRNKPSIMRALGLAAGDLWSVLKSGKVKSAGERQQVSRKVEEEKRAVEGGEVTLRRTTIEEIEFRRKEDSPQ